MVHLVHQVLKENPDRMEFLEFRDNRAGTVSKERRVNKIGEK